MNFKPGDLVIKIEGNFLVHGKHGIIILCVIILALSKLHEAILISLFLHSNEET